MGSDVKQYVGVWKKNMTIAHKILLNSYAPGRCDKLMTCPTVCDDCYQITKISHSPQCLQTLTCPQHVGECTYTYYTYLHGSTGRCM